MDKKKTKLAHKRSCDACNKVFTKRRYWQRFCGESCREKWHATLRADVSNRIRLEREILGGK